MKLVYSFFFILCFLLNVQHSYSQATEKAVPADSIKLPKHSPKVAALMSAVVPGAGQVYNRKYWKLPVVYIGFGVLGYFAVNNWNQYRHFKQAYIDRNDPNVYDEYDISNPEFNGKSAYSEENLFAIQNYYHRNFELTIVGIALVYMLNVVDASVDAHLFRFDISDNLSLHISPEISSPLLTKNPTSGIKLTLRL